MTVTTETPPKKWADIPRAMQITGLTKGQLSQMRYLGTGPTYYKPGPKTILYPEDELLAWMESMRHDPSNNKEEVR